MNKNDFIQALQEIHLSRETQNRIIENCKMQPSSKPHRFRPLISTAAAVLIILLLFNGLPNVRQDNEKTLPHRQNALLIKAHAQDYGTVELIEDKNIFIPSGNCFVYTSKVINGENSTIICGMQAPDFVIEGENIKSITYAAEKGTLFCEFNSYDHDDQGNYIWSSSFAIAPVEEYRAYLQDISHPTEVELAKILEDLHAKGDLKAFYNQIYAMELAKTDGLTGTAYEKAYQSFLDRCSQPIDFHQFALSAAVDYDHTGRQIMIITIINPEHPPIKPVEAQTITANSGDTVTWYLANSEYGKEILGKKVQDINFADIRDRIRVSVTFQDGHTQTCDIFLQYSKQGELSIKLEQ